MFRFRTKYSIFETIGKIPTVKVKEEEILFISKNVTSSLAVSIMEIDKIIDREKLFNLKEFAAIIESTQIVGEFFNYEKGNCMIEVRYFDYTIPEKDSFNLKFPEAEAEIRKNIKRYV